MPTQEPRTPVGHPGKHEQFGYYSGTFCYTVKVDISDAANGAYTGTVRVRVEMSLTERRIEIGQELVKDPCLFSAILGHYGQHAAFDDKVLSRFAKSVTVTLNSEPTSSLQGDPQSVEEDRGFITEFAKRVVEQGLPAFDAERNAASKTVDTSARIQKLEEGCYTHA